MLVTALAVAMTFEPSCNHMLKSIRKTSCQMQVQRVYLADVGCARASAVFGVSASALSIELQGEDLVGRVAVGTCLSVYGTVALTHMPDSNAVRAWTTAQVPNISTSVGETTDGSLCYNCACRLHWKL